MGYTSSLGGMEFLHSVPSKSNHTQYIYMFSVLTENEERITINTFLFGASFLVQKRCFGPLELSPSAESSL